MIRVIDSADVISEQGRGVENDPTAANVQDQAPSEINIELMHDLQVLVDRLASKANRLINNFTTNIAEIR